METVKVVIRMAGEFDAEAVAGLLGELGYPTSTDAAAKRLAEFGDSDRDHVLVAVIDGRVLGC